jgi:hypothetical protein
MNRNRLVGVSALMLALAFTAAAHGQFERDGLSPFEQASMADLIILGKVTDLETQPVIVERSKGADKVGHLVAAIHVEENLFGAKGLTHVRVGFVPEIPSPARNPTQPFLG